MKKRSGFTLIEILVVLAIIAILAALLFPAFNSARETGRQATCATNLQKIFIAVQQYRKDEGRYPDTIVDLMSEGAKYDNGTGAAVPLGNNAPGYLAGGQDSLICLNDDTLSDVPRSSYGFISKNTPTVTFPNPVPTTFTGDFGQYVWNYWGYRDDGYAYISPSEARAGNPASATTPLYPNLVNTTQPFQHPLLGDANTNVVKYSMSNKFAPSSTIITHCVYHRLNTANNLNSPGELYGTTNPEASAKARDIVLRLDGVAKAVDVSPWKSTDPAKPKLWQIQTP